MIDKLTQTNNLNKFLACLGIFTLSLGFGSGLATLGHNLNLNPNNLSLASSFYSRFSQLNQTQRSELLKNLKTTESVKELTPQQKEDLLRSLGGERDISTPTPNVVPVVTNLASKAGLKPVTAGSPGHCSTQTTSRSASCCLAKNLDALGRCPNFGGRTPTQLYAVDGDASSNSLWCSQKVFTSGEDWIYVDLGDKADIESVKITFADGASAGGKYACTRATDYQIQTSNDKTTWTNQVTIKGNNKDVISHTLNTKPTARYVRLLTTKVLDNSGWRLGVREFEVVGISQAPEVKVRANGQDELLTLPANSTAYITWVTANVSGCKASGGWSGDKGPVGSELTGQVFEAIKTYTLTCNKPGGGTISDDVKVVVGDGNLGLADLKVRVLPPYFNPATPDAAGLSLFRSFFNFSFNTASDAGGEDLPDASIEADQAELPSYGTLVQLTWTSDGPNPNSSCILSQQKHSTIPPALSPPRIFPDEQGGFTGGHLGGQSGTITLGILPPGVTTIQLKCVVSPAGVQNYHSYDYVDIVSPQRCEVGFSNITGNLNQRVLAAITEDGFSEWSDVSQSERIGVFNTDAYDASGGRNDIADSMAESQRCFFIDVDAGLVEFIGDEEDIGNPHLDSVKEFTDQGLAVHFTFGILSGPLAGSGHAVIALDVQKSGFFNKTYVVTALDPNGPSLIDLTFTKADEPITLTLPGKEPFVGRFHIAQYEGGSVIPFSLDTNYYSLPSETAYCRTSPNPNQEYCSRVPTDWLAAGNYPDINNFGSVSSPGGVCRGWTNFVLAVAYNGVFVGECPAPRI